MTPTSKIRTDELRRLHDESQVRLAAARDLREENAIIARHSRRCLEASRLLLGRGAVPQPVANRHV